MHLPQSRFSHTITTYPTNGVSYPLLSTLHTRYRLTLTSSSPYVAELRNFGAPSDDPTALLSVRVNITTPWPPFAGLGAQECCNVPDQWVLGPVLPATETLRVVICCPKDGRLTFEGWVVVKVSPRHSPNTNGFNNHFVVQCSNPVLERSAAEPLKATRPFATASCSACRKNTPVSQSH